MKNGVFVIDPPWDKKKGGLRKERPKQGRTLNYNTMSVKDIFALLDSEIFAMAENVHVVFLWSIDQFLHDSEHYMEERGYRRHCRFIWDKTNGVAPAFTIRYTHEYLIWFYKPKMIPINQKFRGVFTTVFQEKAREHSRKPDVAYKMIEQLYPSISKIDVFSREKRIGWNQWGNEVDYFSDL